MTGDVGRGIAHDGLHRAATVINQLRQSEVEDLRLSARGNEDVCGLQIAVDDAFAVRNVERVGDLRPNVEDLVERQRVTVDLPVQAFAFQQLHGDEVLSVALLDRVDGADIRMIQR